MKWEFEYWMLAVTILADDIAISTSANRRFDVGEICRGSGNIVAPHCKRHWRATTHSHTRTGKRDESGKLVFELMLAHLLFVQRTFWSKYIFIRFWFNFI